MNIFIKDDSNRVNLSLPNIPIETVGAVVKKQIETAFQILERSGDPFNVTIKLEEQ